MNELDRLKMIFVLQNRVFNLWKILCMKKHYAPRNFYWWRLLHGTYHLNCWNNVQLLFLCLLNFNRFLNIKEIVLVCFLVKVVVFPPIYLYIQLYKLKWIPLLMSCKLSIENMQSANTSKYASECKIENHAWITYETWKIYK